ncbi:unnamed protein product [Pseudo-nitzschia multistriata]|uniref:Uncharacterized protein n=1 Tax=Pseudo-nitzschia multistriata TaxID=183589 RepID=A0A448Z3M1_9STRA|nr:unnamed protein product [Pseudo-nitzschia multistriata]
MSSAPKKYIKIKGVMKMNPEYKAWKNRQESGGAVPIPQAAATSPKDNALPVISNMDDHMQLNEDLGTDVPLAEATNATIEMMQEPDISLEAGMQPDEMVDELGAVLGKYEVPMGLMNKLIMLSEFDSLEFIIDDSGSMQMISDTINPLTRKPNTRWQEAHQRLKEMIEILAYVPFQQIGIEFLNRQDRILLTRQGMAPRDFLTGAYDQIDAQFARGPSGTTPVLEKLQTSLLRGQGHSIARYFFGDGVPNGGQMAVKEIARIVTNRAEPAANPITFLSCTNQDDDVEWMKETEEIAPYCSESDDYGDESREVLGDQGEALPYTRGFWLICQLVAAMNPDDLDAMDESIPFTKMTLDNLLGIVHNEASYKYYFDSFLENQRKRSAYNEMDRLKKNTRWSYHDFLNAAVAKDISQVRDFKQKMARMNHH